MELADVTDSKSVGSDTVSVRPRLPAPFPQQKFFAVGIFLYKILPGKNYFPGSIIICELLMLKKT